MSLTLTQPAAPVCITACLHCGTRFRQTAQLRDYCCAGCQFVHDLIAKNDLDHFYELLDGGMQPVKSLVFQKRDYTWLAELAAQAEAGAQGAATLRLELQGLTCLGCVWLIEKLFARAPGALAIEVDSGLGRVLLRWCPGAFDIVVFARDLQSFGYLVGPLGAETKPASRTLHMRLGVCAALAMNAMLFTLPGYLGMERSSEFTVLFGQFAFIISTLSLLIGGSYFFNRAWQGLRHRMLHIDLPISLGILAAYAGSVYARMSGVERFAYFDFVSIFVFLMLVGRWLQQKAVDRNRSQILSAQSDVAPVALADGGGKVEVASIEPGLAFVVAPGQLIPVRSMLRADGATLSLEWINGESEPVTARRGRVVPSGALHCGQSPIALEALEAWPASVLARLLATPPPAAHRNVAVERFIRGYIFVVLGLGLSGFAGWWHATGDLLAALQVIISVLVVSCPCASGIALPLADDLAAAGLRKSGVFIRESSLWPRLERIRKVLFDKTGTLTLETTALQEPDALYRLKDEQKSVLLAMVQDNLHPASCCLRELLLAEGVEPQGGCDICETIGFGLETTHEGETWRLGRPEWAKAGAATGADCVFACDGIPLAGFNFCEAVRADAVEEVSALRERGCSVFILSGDRRVKVETMAAHLGLAQGCCRGEMTPEEKAEWVRELDARDTLFIGDGANDSLAFNAAFCTGTPAIDRGLLERKADFYFLGRGLSGVRHLFAAAALRRRTIRRVLTFTIAYNAAAIGLSLAGHMSPLVAAILMPASSLVSLAIVFAARARGGSIGRRG